MDVTHFIYPVICYASLVTFNVLNIIPCIMIFWVLVLFLKIMLLEGKIKAAHLAHEEHSKMDLNMIAKW